jgi:hypothetical protein
VTAVNNECETRDINDSAGIISVLRLTSSRMRRFAAFSTATPLAIDLRGSNGTRNAFARRIDTGGDLEYDYRDARDSSLGNARLC